VFLFQDFARATLITLTATDAGFVTSAGGSAKGDGTIVPAAKYNYSVGFELHYGTGALFAPLSPMMRKNYFVFDLTGVTELISEAKLTLYTGTLESADASELYLLNDTTDMAGALGDAAGIAGGAVPSDFDSPADPLVGMAAMLYSKLADGPTILGGLVLTPAMDDTFVDITFGPAGLGYLNSFLGTKIILSGFVPTAMPPDFPQQPFGFTGPDIPGGDPKTPSLTLTLVPEPSAASLLGIGGLMIFLRWRAGLKEVVHKRSRIGW
jgi:hypothetical protein